MKRHYIILFVSLVIVFGCSMYISCAKNDNDEFAQRTVNKISEYPPHNEITFDIAEYLIGRYEAENDPDMYFEIKENGEAELSINYLEGYRRFTSESLLLTAYYYYYQGNSTKLQSVDLSFNLIKGNEILPLEGLGLSLNFKSDGQNYQVFKPLVDNNNEIKVKFIKIK